jgi:acyl-CoA hydrolase
MSIYKNANEAILAAIPRKGARVFIHTAAATPAILLNAITEEYQHFSDLSFISVHTEGNANYAEERYKDHFSVNTFFVGPNLRKHVQAGRAQYIPIFLSEIPALFRSGRMPLDVALISVSKPNAKGYCSLGCSIDISHAAVSSAKVVIAQINSQMPFVHGDGIIHINDIDAAIEVNTPLFEHKPKKSTQVEQKVGENIASLVEDGATLQMGIGGIPDAALKFLTSHKNLGVHTEMCTDGVVDLVEKGVINNSQKVTDTGKLIAGFAFGTRKIYDFIDHNPLVQMKDVSYVNDTRVIRKNPKVTAINSALEVDVYGQVCADSLGTQQYSGVGGQMDFIRGATLSEGGKGIIALPSRTSNGTARIVPILKAGASVVTTRAHVQYIVTEYGIANLYAKNLKERAKQMVEIAHPDDRAWISEQLFNNAKILI